MKIEFQTIGHKDIPPSVELPTVPQRGDKVEFENFTFIVVDIRFLIEKAGARILVEIKPAEARK